MLGRDFEVRQMADILIRRRQNNPILTGEAGVLRLGPPVAFGLSFLFVVAGGIYDVLSRRRVHRVYLWGGALILVSVPVRLAISGTAAWRALAGLLTR